MNIPSNCQNLLVLTRGTRLDRFHQPFSAVIHFYMSTLHFLERTGHAWAISPAALTLDSSALLIPGKFLLSQNSLNLSTCCATNYSSSRLAPIFIQTSTKYSQKSSKYCHCWVWGSPEGNEKAHIRQLLLTADCRMIADGTESGDKRLAHRICNG